MDNIWKVVKEIKSGSSIDITCGVTASASKKDFLYSNNFQVTQVAAVENQLNVVPTHIRFQNMTIEDLKNAAEMFMYLNTCIGSLKPWFVFYKDLFKNKSPDLIILTLNRIMKGRSMEKGYFKIMAMKLLNFWKRSVEYENKQSKKYRPNYSAAPKGGMEVQVLLNGM